jgi:spore maturation protein A
MNILFSGVLLLCSIIILIQSPENFLAALLDGGSRAATLCVSLIATYSVWMGLIKVWEDSGVTHGVSKLLRPLAKKLFKTNDQAALDAVCMNLSVNLLGVSGAATPYGVKAAQLLDRSENAEYASAMFFVLNATSLQLLPTSLIAVRVSMHSLSPADIVFPTLLTTLFSTLLGGFLTWLLLRPKKREKLCGFLQTQGAGTR